MLDAVLGFFGYHEVGGHNQLYIILLGVFNDVFGGSDIVFFGNALANLVALGLQKCIGHCSANYYGVGFIEETF